MPAIAIVACQKPDRNTPIQNVVEKGNCTEVHFVGDYAYNDGAVSTINGVSPPIAKFGDPSNTVANAVLRFEYAYGRTGRPQYRKFWEYVDAGRIVARCMEDDHDFGWNDNDFKLATFQGAFNVADGTSTTDTIAMTDVLATWRTYQTACRQVRDSYFANKMGTQGNGNIPSEMVGVGDVSASDFVRKYYFVDYDANMQVLQTLIGFNAPVAPGTAVRFIVPDCKSYTDPAGKVDDINKSPLGNNQDKWLRACITDGQGAKAKVTIAWTKDIFNRDNGDGGVSFRAYFDDLLQWIHNQGYGCDHFTGDRHNPHAGIARTTFGASYDATTVCVCPAGQSVGGLTQYPENIMSYQSNDACIVGTLELDMVNEIKYLTMRDFFTWEPICQVKLKFGERVPTLPVYIAKQLMYSNKPANLRIAYAASGTYTWPGTGVAWVNTAPVPVSVAVAASSITAASISTDGGITFDNVLHVNPSTGGYWIVPPGGQLKISYTGITAFVTCAVQSVAQT